MDTETIELHPQAVFDLTMACLPAEGSTAPITKVEGLVRTYGFETPKLEQNRATIEAMMSHIPDKAFTDGGGGMHFSEFCMDRDGRLWTGDHAIMESLVCLAIGIGKARYCLEREFWPAMGGLPYIQFDR